MSDLVKLTEQIDYHARRGDAVAFVAQKAIAIATDRIEALEFELQAHRKHLTAAEQRVDDQIDRIEELERERSKLLAAIAWLEPPFVTDATPADELRQRVQFCVTDAAAIRALMERRMSDLTDKADAWDAASVSWRKGYERGRREALEEAARAVKAALDPHGALMTVDLAVAAIRALMELPPQQGSATAKGEDDQGAG